MLINSKKWPKRQQRNEKTYKIQKKKPSQPMEIIADKESFLKNEVFRGNEKILELAIEIIKVANTRDITLRLMGSAAIWIHCPKYRYLFYKFSRLIPDIDLAGYHKQVIQIQNLFLGFGFKEDKYIMRLFGSHRRVFENPEMNIKVDLALDKLHFCHDINLKNRLELDYPTIALSDLLLSKLQIIQITKNDILDIIILLMEHEMGNSNNEMIDIEYIAKLCSLNWGLWKTLNINLEKTKNLLASYLEGEEIKIISSKIDSIIFKINSHKKSFKWKIRNIIGERIQWYNDVEELKK